MPQFYKIFDQKILFPDFSPASRFLYACVADPNIINLFYSVGNIPKLQVE